MSAYRAGGGCEDWKGKEKRANSGPGAGGVDVCVGHGGFLEGFATFFLVH